MLQQLLGFFGGPATTAAFVNPAGGGAGGFVSPGSAFANVLGSLGPQAYGSAGGIPGFGGGGGFPGFGGTQGGFPAGYGGVPQAYGNAQNQRSTSLIKQALRPGAVLVGSRIKERNDVQAQRTAGLGAFAANPLQGFAGQAQGGFIGGAPQAAGGFNTQPGGFAFAPNGLGQGGFFSLQTILLPIMSLIGVFKSLFNFRKTVGSMQPIVVDRYDTGYYGYQQYLDNANIEGAFDEPPPYERGNTFLGLEGQERDPYF